MSTKGVAKRPFWTSLFLLVYLLAMILPASTVSAADQPGTCVQTSVQQASVAAVMVPADDQETQIPKEKVDLAVFSANWRSKLTDAERVEHDVFDMFIVYGSGGFSSDIYRQIYEAAIENVLPIMGDSGDYDLIIHTMLNVALGIPEMAPDVPAVWQALIGQGRRVNGGDFYQQVGQSAARYNLTDQLLESEPEILAEVYACAHEIPEVANAFNKYHSEALNANIDDSATEILEKNPDLPVPTEIRGKINEDGTITISLDQLKALSESEFEKIHASIDDMQETLVEIDKQQDVIIDYIKDQELKAKYQELAKKKAAEHQLKVDAAKASVSILSTLIGQIDPELGKQVATIGTSTIQVAESLNGWLKAVSGLNGLDKVASLSTVVMTGNVLGAVMNVVALFRDPEVTPEQMILEEIGKLRQQVDQLRQEMHIRFDRIDEELNAIYTTMHDRFNQIDIQLGKINGNIQEVQQSLLTLDLKLSRIERNNFEFLNALGRRPLLDAINGGLGYEQRTGQPMPFQPDFVNFENTLQSWGTIHAFDPVNAGPTQRDYSDGQMLAELNAYPLDANINYLNGWLLTHGLSPIADKQLASPRDWLFASRAYTQLGLEWPEHMKQIDPQRQAEMDEIGVELETAMHNISTVQTPSGPQGNTLLFTTVITHYQDKLGLLDSTIQSFESAFIDEIRANRLQRSEPFDLYGGIDQTLTYQAEGFKQMSHGGPGEALPVPSNLLIPNLNQYNLSEYLKLFGAEQGGISMSAVLLNRRPQPGCTPEPDICPVIGDLRIVVAAHYGDVSIIALELMAGRVTLQVKNGDLEGVDDYVVRNWGSLKTRFEAEAVEIVPSAELAQQRADLFNDMTTKLEQRLASYQREMYQRILNELTAGSLQPLAIELGGSKVLLDSFVILGLERTLGNDEFLHAMLFGNQQLVDDSQIGQSYVLSITQPISRTGLLVNPRLVIGQEAAKRTAAFNELIMKYLDAITTKTHVEAADFIANTRRALDLTMRIVKLELPEPVDEAIEGLQASSDGPTLLGSAIHFSAHVSQGSNISYAWDFGDGKAGIGANPTHTYGEPGVYDVRVTASNSAGQRIAEMQVIVEPTNAGQSTQKVYLPSLDR